MEKLPFFLLCAVSLLLGSELSSEAQTKKPETPAGRSDNKSKIVALNTNELEALPYDAGKVKFIVSSEETNGAWAVVELTEMPGYKTTWHRHNDLEEAYYVVEGVWTVKIADKTYEFPAGSYALIPRGMPHGQGNFTDKPVRLLLTVTPGGLEQFFKERVELFKTMKPDQPEFRERLTELRRKYTDIVSQTWEK